MNLSTPISFKPSPEMVKVLESIYLKSNTAETNPDISKTDFINKVVLSYISTDNNENGNNSEAIELLELERYEYSKKILELTLKLEQVNTEFEESRNTKVNTELFTPETKFALWQILKCFQRDNPNFTFENMIIHVIQSFQSKGFLKFDQNDLNYLNTLEYDGTL